MADIVAALDGGGSKTDIVWADADGRSQRHRIDSGCNPQDRRDWLVPIRAALDLLPTPPLHITLGLPGYGEIPALDAKVRARITGLCPRATLMNDVALAYHGAFPDGGGVLVLAGTGSMAMAKGPAGLHRTGGWGDAFGDEGSAYAIGRAALSIASQMIDTRRTDSGFAADLMARMGCTPDQGPFALMTWATAQPRRRAAIAALARHVDAMAETGQPTATAILTDAASDLHRHASAAAQLAGLTPPLTWAAAGSVFRSRTLTACLTGLIGSAALCPAQSALTGGLITAARAAGWPARPDWCQTLKETA